MPALPSSRLQSRPLQSRRRVEILVERCIGALIRLCGISAILFVFGIFFFVFREGSQLLFHGFKYREFFFSQEWYPTSESHVRYGALALIAGTAALVTSDPAASPAPAAPQTIRIMDFSDPHSPKVARVFAGVTAMSRDESRGLIFVANADGIWILHQRLAQDPEVEKAYANYVLYGSSMYSPSR